MKSSGEIFFLKAEEIDWIEAEGDYMKFHVNGRTHLMSPAMAAAAAIAGRIADVRELG